MNCFIHTKETFYTYCKVCKRPICKNCSLENETCPRCSNFHHSTLMNYNKRIIKFLIPIIIIRFIIYWDTIVVSFELVFDYANMFPTGILLLTLSIIPFAVSVIKNGFLNAIKYQIIGKTDPIVIVDDKNNTSLLTIVLGLVSMIVSFICFVIVIPAFLITDIIHLFISLKKYSYHKKHLKKEIIC